MMEYGKADRNQNEASRTAAVFALVCLVIQDGRLFGLETDR